MSSYHRKLERNKLKYDLKTNNIKNAWKRKQINQYSLQGYVDLQKNNKNKNIF